MIAAAIGSACHLFAKCPLGERGGQMEVRESDLKPEQSDFWSHTRSETLIAGRRLESVWPTAR